MSTILVHTPATVSAPRGAVWAGWLVSRLVDGLRALSHHRQHQRAESARVAEAAALRAYAHDIAPGDPRFAADLYAAADRHEISK